MILLNRTENLLCVLKLIILEIGTVGSLSPDNLASKLGDFNVFLITVWLAIKLLDGRIIIMETSYN